MKNCFISTFFISVRVNFRTITHPTYTQNTSQSLSPPISILGCFTEYKIIFLTSLWTIWWEGLQLDRDFFKLRRSLSSSTYSRALNIDVQQTKEPPDLSKVGWCVDSIDYMCPSIFGNLNLGLTLVQFYNVRGLQNWLYKQNQWFQVVQDPHYYHDE